MNDEDEDVPIIRPPDTVTAELLRRPLLYLPDGRGLFRRIGFRTEPQAWSRPGDTK